ncbi:pilin [Patescibacteria group bacterium]|nr:pilin [Patescibacteria group bacterium]MBU1683648.1 pilin [Patescibacteria group bacterium]
MKKVFFTILGTLLLIPDTFGITIDTFQEEVYRPENLPIGTTSTSAEGKINEIINFAIDLILYTAGGVAVVMLIVSAIVLIASLGNQERKERAIKIAKFAIIGLFVIILAYAVVTNIIDIIFRATT